MKIKIHGYTIVLIFLVFQPETLDNVEHLDHFEH